ncbi:hypothetical protein FE156_23250 [Streptomyces albidoflavus]|nr:hypothetical protein FE156_23250 [Streptomyces albidoflavus]
MRKRTAMTLKVSRDSGRTWGPVTVVQVEADDPVPVVTGKFPPCTCSRCTVHAEPKATPVRGSAS